MYDVEPKGSDAAWDAYLEAETKRLTEQRNDAARDGSDGEAGAGRPAANGTGPSGRFLR